MAHKNRPQGHAGVGLGVAIVVVGAVVPVKRPLVGVGVVVNITAGLVVADVVESSTL